jgi:hypothetical protein
LSDDLERLLKSVPDRVPPPPRELTGRVRERVVEAFRELLPQSSRGAALLIAAIVLVGGTAFAAGRWTSASSAAADLSIGARPDTIMVAHDAVVTLFGSVPSGRPGEDVVVQANGCGRFGTFYNVEGVRTEVGGVWSLQVPHYKPGERSNNDEYLATKTAFRVRWNERTSDTVVVLVRPNMGIFQVPGKRPVRGKRLIQIGLIAPEIKYRPKVVVERQVGGSWKPLAKLVLRFLRAGTREATVWLRVSKGDVLRYRLPASEAAPCYPADVSPATAPIK